MIVTTDCFPRHANEMIHMGESGYLVPLILIDAGLVGKAHCACAAGISISLHWLPADSAPQVLL